MKIDFKREEYLDYLVKGNYSLLLIKNKKIILKSRLKGLNPFLRLKFLLFSAEIVDKVIGASVAAIAVYYGANSVSGPVMSKHAKEILDRYRVPSYARAIVDNIKDKNGKICRAERLVSKEFDVKKIYGILKQEFGC